MKVLVLLLMVFSTVSGAAQKPVFQFTPLTSTSFTILSDEVAEVVYMVTNQTKKTRRLGWKPIEGVTQDVSYSDSCIFSKQMAPGDKCRLALKIDGSTLGRTISEAPIVCGFKSNAALNPFLCASSSYQDRLNVRPGRLDKTLISLSPTSLTLTAPGGTGTITVTNESATLEARNVAADFLNTVLASNVTQDASDCVSIPAQGTCTLSFTAGNVAISTSSVPVYGSNTVVRGFQMTIEEPGSAQISATGSPLILDADDTSVSSKNLLRTGESGTITVTNNDAAITATNITGDISGSLEEAGVTEDASDCTSVAPGASCNLIFTAGSSGAHIDLVPVSGSNTSLDNAYVAVNGPPELTIELTSGSPLTLSATGTDTGTMTITNTSTSEVSAGVTADFSGTALAGNVTATTCEAIPAGGTCTITFTSGTNIVAATNFPIYGEDTTTVEGSITITAPTYAYMTYTNGSSTANQLTYCPANVSNGKFGLCTNYLDASAPINQPRGIAINPAGTYMYIASYGDESVTKCQRDTSTNAISNCTNAIGSVTFNYPMGVALNPAGTRAYITDRLGDTVTKCDVNSTSMDLENCVVTIPSSLGLLDQPTDIKLNRENTRAYVSNFIGEIITQCDVDGSDGSLTSCTNFAFPNPDGSQFNGLAFNPSEDKLFSSDFNTSRVFECVLSTGVIQSCIYTSHSDEILFRSAGIAVNAENTHISIMSSESQVDTYTVCDLNSSGNVASCSNPGLPPEVTWGIAWAPSP